MQSFGFWATILGIMPLAAEGCRGIQFARFKLQHRGGVYCGITIKGYNYSLVEKCREVSNRMVVVHLTEANKAGKDTWFTGIKVFAVREFPKKGGSL